MRDSFRSVRTTHGELNSKIESSLAGIRLTKAYNNEQFEVEKFENINEVYASSWTEAYRQMAIFSSGNELFNAVINLMLLVIGAIFVSKGDIDSNDLLAYFLYINFLTRPVNRLIAMTTNPTRLFWFRKVYVDYGYQTVHHESSGSNPFGKPERKNRVSQCFFQLSGR